MKLRKKIIPSLLISIIIFCVNAYAQNTSSFNIKGNFHDAKVNGRVYLHYRTYWDRANPLKLDSAEIKNGLFYFTGNLRQSVPAELFLSPDNKREIYLEKGANIFIDSPASLQTAIIKGSKINDDWPGYKTALESYTLRYKELTNRSLHIPVDKQKDEEYLASLKKIGAENSHIKERLQRMYIARHPDSYFSLEAFRELVGNIRDTVFVAQLFRQLSTRLQTMDETQYYRDIFVIAKQTGLHKVLPSFELRDANEKLVKLSDYRGKYVLVDFWASWCGPCMAEVPNVVNVFNLYKDKNFTVLGVSEDHAATRVNGLEAIKKNKMTWTTVFDSEQIVQQQYGIITIPRNYLLNPAGEIIASDLRGQDLEKKLKEVLQ